jgi:hypothetical protein
MRKIKLIKGFLIHAFLFIVAFSAGVYSHFKYSEYMLNQEELKLDKIASTVEYASESEWALAKVKAMEEQIREELKRDDSYFNVFFDEEILSKRAEQPKDTQKVEKATTDLKKIKQTQEFVSKELKKFDKKVNIDFERWLNREFGGGKVKYIRMRETQDLVTYTVDLKDILYGEYSVQVSKSWVKISGMTKRRYKQGEANYASSQWLRSSFNIVLPVPKGVDGAKTRTKGERKRIRLYMEKLK